MPLASQPNASIIGLVLRRARQARGWTLQDLAKRLHLSVTVLHGYESGLVDPPSSTLLRLARVLRVRLDAVQRARGLWAA